MLLADLGAEVIQVGRPGGAASPAAQVNDVTSRSKRRIVVDLEHPHGAEVVLRLAAASDALIEGYTPGVAEQFGVGPPDCLARNPALVYGRMTGWGQDGPQTASAGHDIAYIALTAALHAIGRADGSPPRAPARRRHSRHVDQRASPMVGSRRSAHSREVLAGPGFHDLEELLTDGAVIQHATGSDLE